MRVDSVALGIALVALALSSLFTAGCKESCLGGERDCRMVSPCQKLSFSCDGDELEVRTLGVAPGPGGMHALGARGDVLLQNGQVVAVVAGIGNQNYIDPQGGSLLDLGNRGKDNDGLVQLVQVTGILPDDSVFYTSLTLLDERPLRIAVQAKGHLFHRPEIPVHTLYELRPCDSGIRVRTEVVNGSPDPQQWMVADGYYWSGRGPLPFTPSTGTGFEHASFNLLTINDAFRFAPFLTASPHSNNEVSYAEVGCGQDPLEGFQSSVVSSFGLRRSVVMPRDYRVFERFIAVAPHADVASAADIALEVRRQLHGERWVTVTGSIAVDSGRTFGGERDASLLFSEGTPTTPANARIPWTQVVPDASGQFSARLPAGRSYVLELHSFGRVGMTQDLGMLTQDRDLGSIDQIPSARLTVTVTDGVSAAPLDAEIFVVPADDATLKAVTGTLHGQLGKCAPWLGSPAGPSPACNRFLVSHLGGATAIQLLPGRYYLYAYHGPFFSLARQTLDLLPGDTRADFRLSALPLAPVGTLSADLHVHGSASFDSSIPDLDRVLSFAASNMDVIIATDHDVVQEYGPIVAQLDLASSLSTVSGVETTGHIPFMRIPDSPYPLVIGHYNFWPLAYQPTLPRNGGPFEELVEPGELFDRTEPLFTALPIIQLNHPWAPGESGRDLGFPRALSLNTLRNLPSVDDGTSAGMYVRSPKGGHHNNDHHTQEVMNGTQNDVLLQYRAFWFYTLNQGQLKTGTANSDSHGLTDNTIGAPRNLVRCDTRPGPSFDITRFNQALRDGTTFGTNGPIIEATLTDATGEHAYGLTPFHPNADAKVRFTVSAAPWVPVEEIRFIVNGKIVKTIGPDALLHPTNPFAASTLGLVRYTGEIPLAALMPTSGDAWLVIEAGSPLQLLGDLGGGLNGEPDGIVDTSDNNGDGKVDAADVEKDATFGPITNPPQTTDEADPNFHFAKVQDSYPFAFTNPFVLDRDGNGVFDAPKVEGSR